MARKRKVQPEPVSESEQDVASAGIEQINKRIVQLQDELQAFIREARAHGIDDDAFVARDWLLQKIAGLQILFEIMNENVEGHRAAVLRLLNR